MLVFSAGAEPQRLRPPKQPQEVPQVQAQDLPEMLDVLLCTLYKETLAYARVDELMIHARVWESTYEFAGCTGVLDCSRAAHSHIEDDPPE